MPKQGGGEEATQPQGQTRKLWAEADPYLYRVNPQLYNLANESKLAGEAAKIKCGVIRRSKINWRIQS